MSKNKKRRGYFFFNIRKKISSKKTRTCSRLKKIILHFWCFNHVFVGFLYLIMHDQPKHRRWFYWDLAVFGPEPANSKLFQRNRLPFVFVQDFHWTAVSTLANCYVVNCSTNAAKRISANRFHFYSFVGSWATVAKEPLVRETVWLKLWTWIRVNVEASCPV